MISPRFYRLLTVFSGTLLAVITIVFLVDAQFRTRFFPSTIIEGVQVGGLTTTEARMLIENSLPPLPDHTLTLEFEEAQLSTSSSFLEYERTTQATVQTIFDATHPPNVLRRTQHFLWQLLSPPEYGIATEYNSHQVNIFIEAFNDQVYTPGSYATAELSSSGNPDTLRILPGEQGVEIDRARTKIQVERALETGTRRVIVETQPTVQVLNSEADHSLAHERALRFIGSSLLLESEFGKKELTDQELLELLQLPTGFREDLVASLAGTLEKHYNREAQDAVFEYDPDTLEVSTFIPDRSGIQLDLQQFTHHLLEKLKAIEDTAHSEQQPYTLPLPLILTPAEHTLASTNSLGIQERIGFGESEYAHSIPSRIHNVSHTSEKITNTLIPPGEEFSFNAALGEVSRATGFQPAYVIRNGRTELGDGGGVCQVSTTLFRSVLDAGLPVTRRLQHSYRVSYYELNAKPGIDATVYSGNVDLRFINDTEQYILIHSQADSTNLTMFVELYGTSDGRSTEIIDHTTWDYSPPLPPVFIEDPSLPPGKREQIDWAVAGIKAKFTNVVRDAKGEVIREDEYYSNYRPWSAKYLVGPSQ